MAAKVKAGATPYTAGFARLTGNRHSQSTWTPNPQATVSRGAGGPQNYAILYNDIHAAYQNALRRHVTGESAHADTAVAILNAWSAKLTRLQGSADRFLAAGLYGYQFANAAELVRDHGDFDLARFQKMMRDVFAPLSEDFLQNRSAGSSKASADPSAGLSAQGGRSDSDLAATGSSDVPLWTAATGITAVAGGLLLIRHRGQARRDTE